MDVDIGADDVDPLDFVPVTSFTPDDGAQRQEADIRVRVKSLTLSGVETSRMWCFSLATTHRRDWPRSELH
eukprot:g29854.t1